MPTEFQAQNGLQIVKNTAVSVTGCSTKVAVSSKRVKGRNVTLTVYVPAAGRLSAHGKGLAPASKRAAGTEFITLTLHAKPAGAFKTKVKLAFTPAKGRKQLRTIAASFKR